MQADPEDDLFGFTMFTVALGNGLLKFNRRRQGIDSTGKLDERPISRQLDEPAAVLREYWFQAFLTIVAQARQRPRLIPPH
jgi:hypothetical protein